MVVKDVKVKLAFLTYQSLSLKFFLLFSELVIIGYKSHDPTIIRDPAVNCCVVHNQFTECATAFTQKSINFLLFGLVGILSLSHPTASTTLRLLHIILMLHYTH